MFSVPRTCFPSIAHRFRNVAHFDAGIENAKSARARGFNLNFDVFEFRLLRPVLPKPPLKQTNTTCSVTFAAQHPEQRNAAPRNVAQREHVHRN
jgi:hypothetical protein